MIYHLKLKKLNDRAIFPTKAKEDDIGLDLYNYISFKIPSNERRVIGTGIAIQIPKSYAGFVQSRSGLSSRFGISVLNSPGLIDPGYRGEVKVILQNHSDRDFEFEAGSRIAQLVIIPVVVPELIEVSELENSARGEAGLGSTGV
jgi:dUTP pyrophosphatase